jgi:hypothetical protein
MRSIYLAVATALLMLFVYSCSSSSKSTTPDDGKEQEIKKVTELATWQAGIGAKVDSMLMHMDTTAVKDSVLKIIRADVMNVTSAESNSQGIMIQYTNGLLGGILLDPEDMSSSASEVKGTLAPAALGGEPGIGHKPGSKKTIFLNPSYWERHQWANPLMGVANESFAQVGMDDFDVYINDQCTLDRFTSLSGYGIVHIYSHGIAWPNKNNIREVFLMTGEPVSNATTRKYWADVQAHSLSMIFDHGDNRYMISPSFFARHNNFSDDTTLVYGGFCYSGLGGWKDTLIQIAKAGAYVGFDWHVLTSWNAAWARHMYTHMSDTSLVRPMPLAEWRSADPDTDNTYFDNEPADQKWVSVWNYGYADLVLWRALKILGIDPPAAPVGETVRVRGVGFGATKGSSTITFNDVLASPTSWSDTLIVTQVPVGTTDGNVVVTVGAEHSNGFHFALAEVTISIDADTVRMFPNDSVYFRTTVTGTTDTAVTWEVLESIPKWPDVKAGNFYLRGPNLTNFWVSVNFVGICHVVASAHADTTKKDTVTVVVSVMDRLRQTPYINCRFDGQMIFNVTCAQINYDLSKAFVIWNSQQNGMPTVHWEGNTFSIDGDISWNSIPWEYHERLIVSGTLSTLGDTLLSCSIYYREWGNDPYYRQWYHWVEVTNVPLSSFTITGNNNQFNFEVEGSSVQNYLTKLEDYYYETAANGSCYYERKATTADWSSTNPEPNLRIQLDIRQIKVRGIDLDSTAARERGASQIAK